MYFFIFNPFFQEIYIKKKSVSAQSSKILKFNKFYHYSDSKGILIWSPST